MAQRIQNPKSPDVALRRHKAEPSWLWLALIAGSAAIHAVLAIAAMPLLRLSAPAPQIISSVPIELIDLPAAPSESSKSSPVLASIAASPSQTSLQTASGQNPPAPGGSVPQPPAATPPKISQANTPIVAAGTSKTSPLPGVNPPGSSPSVQTEATAPSTTEATANAPDATLPLSQGAEGTETGTASDPTTSPSPQITPEATPSEPPGFATIPIDIPTPDVSETLPISPSASPSPLAQVGVSRENTPVSLTVSLDFERIPAAEAGDDPDRPAAPVGGVDSREISTLDESTCAGALKPEIMQSLGVKVALQVSTDHTGRVTRTAAQVPSRNAAYNELARCLVQHWDFIPAEEAGEPVPSDALRVWVIIEQT